MLDRGMGWLSERLESRYWLVLVGDAVNVAARVEAATRQTGDDVLITEATKRLLLRRLAVVSRRTVPLKGKAEPLEVFSPLALVEDGLADPVRR